MRPEGKSGFRRAIWATSVLGGLSVLGPIAMGWADTSPQTEVAIDNFTFQPGTITIKRGAQVSWVNHDDIPHSIVLISMAVRSSAIDTDGSFNQTFNESGTFSYVCGLHPFMKGQVIVSP